MRANSDRRRSTASKEAHRTGTARRLVRGAAVCGRLTWHGDFGDSPGVGKLHSFETAIWKTLFFHNGFGLVLFHFFSQPMAETRTAPFLSTSALAAPTKPTHVPPPSQRPPC